MAATTTVSIIICTRNRARHLRETLDAVVQLDIPADIAAELVVVDNGSADDTAEVVRALDPEHMTVRYVYEGRTGKGHAYNAGLVASRGRVLLFTDDDVRPPRDWVERMCRPIIHGAVDAIAGGVTIPKQLERPWLVGFLRGWVACTEGMMGTEPPPSYPLIGANMAFARCVLEKVPAFDPALGPGALGFGEETLFTYQLQAAGYRTRVNWEITVEHHFEAGRLNLASFERDADKRAASQAYIAHHWEHRDLKHAYLQYLWHRLKLACLEIWHWRDQRFRQEPTPWRMALLYEISLRRHYCHERVGPRNYERFGLIKLASPSPTTRAFGTGDSATASAFAAAH